MFLLTISTDWQKYKSIKKYMNIDYKDFLDFKMSLMRQSFLRQILFYLNKSKDLQTDAMGLVKRIKNDFKRDIWIIMDFHYCDETGHIKAFPDYKDIIDNGFTKISVLVEGVQQHSGVKSLNALVELDNLSPAFSDISPLIKKIDPAFGSILEGNNLEGQPVINELGRKLMEYENKGIPVNLKMLLE